MKRKALSLLALALIGCAGKVLPSYPRTTVYITQGTTVTDARRDHIVDVTRKLCREAGRPEVEKIILDNENRGIVTLAAYLCSGECSGIDDPEDCVPGQKRVLEEVVSPEEENHYITFKMLILTAND